MSGPLRLRVDPIACTGHGICAELLPEMIRLDDWGYPIIEDAPGVPPDIHDVRRAIAACPTLALRLEHVRSASGATTPGPARRGS
jgi:ferredoxin